MRQLLALLARHSRRTVAFAALTGIASGAANAVLLALANHALHAPRPWAMPLLVGAYVGLCLLLPVMRALSSYLVAGLGQQVVLGLRVELSRKIVAAPLRQVEAVGTNRLFAALTEDVAAIVQAVATLPLLMVHLTVVAGSLLYLGWLSPIALAGVAVLLVMGIVGYRVPLARGMGYQLRQREQADRLWADFGAVTGGVKELKLHAGRREAQVARLEATGIAIRAFAVRSATLFSAAAGWGQMVIMGLVGTVVFVLPLVGPVRPETLTGYALVLLYLTSPLEVLLDAVPVFSRAQVAFAQVEKLGLSLDESTADAPALEPWPHGWRRLELDGVTHRYRREGEDGDFVLGPITLALTPGEVVFLTGGNGSGKTTLAKVLVGLYAPDEGAVRLDGAAVVDASREAYLRHFSAVFADFHLFDSLLGLDGPELDARATRLLGRVELSHRVTVQGGRLSTTQVSQGQRKRLALLTALLEDRPIYLFDEWAADQDPVFKKLFYLELLPELKRRGKTVIAITHDDHYYGVADRVLKLDDGRLEYDGPPEGLRYATAADTSPEPAIAVSQ